LFTFFRYGNFSSVSSPSVVFLIFVVLSDGTQTPRKKCPENTCPKKICPEKKRPNEIFELLKFLTILIRIKYNLKMNSENEQSI
jgi:hypothetical protein